MEQLAVEMRNAFGDLRRVVKTGFNSLGNRQARAMERLAMWPPTTEGDPFTGSRVRLSGTKRTWLRGSQPCRPLRNRNPSVVTVEAEPGGDDVGEH